MEPQIATEPSALRVCEYLNIKGQQDIPGLLYFFRAPEFALAVPEHQEAARQKLEDFNTVLRIAFRREDPLFREFFQRLLAIAQATYDPAGFNAFAATDLRNFKREIVQSAGAAIKARYTAQLLWWVVGAVALLLLLTVVVPSFYPSGMPTTSTDKEEPNDEEGSKGTSSNPKPSITFSLPNTGILLSASFVGLLFASMSRSIEPTFETLVTPDADLMQPWFRLVFYGVPVLAIGLLFQTELVTLEFGKQISTAQVGHNWVVAMLVGLFLGIAERALPREVESWSKRFLPSSQTDT
jgi:hypothetical protein